MEQVIVSGGSVVVVVVVVVVISSSVAFFNLPIPFFLKMVIERVNSRPFSDLSLKLFIWIVFSGLLHFILDCLMLTTMFLSLNTSLKEHCRLLIVSVSSTII